MPARCLIRPGSYFDSVVLMRVAAELGARPGVRTASLAMATAANKDVLAAAGLLGDDAAAAGPNDLVIALDADADAADDRTALVPAPAAPRAGAAGACPAGGGPRAPPAPPPPAAGGEPRRPRT